MRFFNRWSICFLWSLFVIGCGAKGPRPDGFPALVPVTVTVNQEGQPLADAQVSLVPSDGAKNWFSGGTTDSGGNVTVTTYGAHSGAPVGKYKVVVSKEVHEGLEEYQAAMAREDEAAARRIDVKVFACVEAPYREAATTPLEIEVVKGTKNYSVDVGKIVKEPMEFLK